MRLYCLVSNVTTHLLVSAVCTVIYIYILIVVGITSQVSWELCGYTKG